jgi:predicted dinucleotide-binding enzyme
MTSVGVEQPNKTRVILESIQSSERRSIVVTPEATSAAKRRKTRGSRETSSAEGEDTLAGAQDVVKGFYIVMRSHGCEETGI